MIRFSIILLIASELCLASGFKDVFLPVDEALFPEVISPKNKLNSIKVENLKKVTDQNDQMYQLCLNVYKKKAWSLLRKSISNYTQKFESSYQRISKLQALEALSYLHEGAQGQILSFAYEKFSQINSEHLDRKFYLDTLQTFLAKGILEAQKPLLNYALKLKNQHFINLALSQSLGQLWKTSDIDSLIQSIKKYQNQSFVVDEWSTYLQAKKMIPINWSSIQTIKDQKSNIVFNKAIIALVNENFNLAKKQWEHYLQKFPSSAYFELVKINLSLLEYLKNKDWDNYLESLAKYKEFSRSKYIRLEAQMRLDAFEGKYQNKISQIQKIENPIYKARLRKVHWACKFTDYWAQNASDKLSTLASVLPWSQLAQVEKPFFNNLFQKSFGILFAQLLEQGNEAKAYLVWESMADKLEPAMEKQEISMLIYSAYKAQKINELYKTVQTTNWSQNKALVANLQYLLGQRRSPEFDYIEGFLKATLEENLELLDKRFTQFLVQPAQRLTKYFTNELAAVYLKEFLKVGSLELNDRMKSVLSRLSKEDRYKDLWSQAVLGLLDSNTLKPTESVFYCEELLNKFPNHSQKTKLNLLRAISYLKMDNYKKSEGILESLSRLEGKYQQEARLKLAELRLKI